MARDTYYYFGRFRLYPTERALECDGVEVRLHRQWLDILLILIRRRDYKVSNKELIGAIWPKRVKERGIADNLYVETRGLRKALTEASPDASQFIKNFRGEGYSFMADVDEHNVPTTVTIQPLTREGSPTVPDATGQRMADTLATMLNKHMPIRVVPSVTAIREYNEHPELSPLAFGHRLLADHVFSGITGRGQVKVSHFDVRAGEEVGATIIKASDPESFETYRLILKWIEAELKLTPTDREAQQSTKQYTTNEKANDFYKKGRIQRFKGTEVSLRKALNYFKRATDEDPQFARAYANFADTHIFMGMMNLITPQKSYEGAKDAAIKARDLDPTMASAHTAWAFTKFFFEREWEEAREGFEEAIAINPNYPVARMGYAHYLISQGHRAQAQREIDEAMALNPYSFFISFVRGMVYFLSREYRESLKRFEWTHELNLRFNLKSDLSHYGLSLAHEYLALSCNTPDEREAEFKHADHEAHLAVIVSDGHPLKLLHRAHVYAMWGKRDKAGELLNRVLRMREEGYYVSPYHLATVYAAMGEDNQAINSLEEAEKVPDQYLFLTGVDPRLDSLRSDPPFGELLLRLGLKF